jgi:bifunctional N-acetylglucosamine-1-phosphate-uridyltransferase/glucosamine-1-phosphate-acetyltransferase GlmU-like protein
MKLKEPNDTSINVLILAASKSAYSDDLGDYPSCLKEVKGKSVLQHIAEKIKFIKGSDIMFAFLDSELQKFHLDNITSLLVPGSKSVSISSETKGSGCTALLCASQLEQENELLIVTANELVEIDFVKFLDNFRKRKLDAGTLIFESVHPRYSFVKLENNYVVEVAQRNPISSNATAGVFWYKKTKHFVNAIKANILKRAEVDNLYFVAPSFNELILKGLKVGTYELKQDEYIPLKNKNQADNINSK